MPKGLKRRSDAFLCFGAMALTMALNPEAKKAFARMDAKLEIVSQEADQTRSRVDQVASLTETSAQGILAQLSEVKGVLYVTLVVATVLLALVLGALLRTYFG
jgi:hypothetical protein